jgi:squalene synthase HpnC
VEVDHNETFRVAGVLLPKALRKPVRVIYQVVRTAADIADGDEGTPAARRTRIADLRAGLDAVAAGREAFVHPLLFKRLAGVVARCGLPLEPFYDLMSAFDQDIFTTRYENRAQLLDYCRRSANPVGHLLLHLIGAATPQNVADSDAICTSLQWVNLLRDIALDWDKGHFYLPLADVARFGVTDAHVAQGICDPAWRALIAHEVAYARAMMVRGAPLARRLPGRFGLELCSVVQGALRVLERIEEADYDVFRQRPVLGVLDWFIIAARTAGMRLFGRIGVNTLSIEGRA